MLGFYRKSKSGLVSTKLKEGDVIGFDASKSAQAIKLFRPSKKKVNRLFFKVFGKTDTPFKNFRWQLDKEGFEALVELMAASAGCNAFPIGYNHLPVTWAYQLYKHV